MLTPTAAAVKFDLPLTPEQQACRAHIDQGLKAFWSLVERLRHAADQHRPMDQVEETIFRDLLTIGRSMLQAFLDMAGTGDVGPTLTIAGDPHSDPDQELPRLDQPRKRPYLSIFGAIDIARICYGHDRVEAAPLDARLHLPQRQYSYLFQRSTTLTPRRFGNWRRSSVWESPSRPRRISTGSKPVMSRCFKTASRSRTPKTKGRCWW